MSSFIPPDCCSVILFGAAWHLVVMAGLGAYQIYFIADNTGAALCVSQPLGKTLPHLTEAVTLMGVFTPMQWGLFADGVDLMLCCC